MSAIIGIPMRMADRNACPIFPLQLQFPRPDPDGLTLMVQKRTDKLPRSVKYSVFFILRDGSDLIYALQGEPESLIPLNMTEPGGFLRRQSVVCGDKKNPYTYEYELNFFRFIL